MICKLCSMYLYPKSDLVLFHSDELCRIISMGQEMICVYAYHQTPKPAHRDWIETQIKIIARKRWNKEWTMQYVRGQHDYWIIRALPNKGFRNKWKVYDKVNKIKSIKGGE